MENFLRSKETWNLVEDGVVVGPQNREPTNEEAKTVAEQQLKDKKTEFEILKMKNGEFVNAYFVRALSIEKQMKACGEIVKENNITEKNLLIHEQRMKGSNEEEQALKVTHEERYERSIGKGIIRDRGRGRGGQFASRVAVECYMCHNLGHYQYESPTWEKRANYVEFNEEEEMLMMAQVDSHRNKKKRVWFLDPGCSNHMSKNKEWFIQLHESFKYSIKLGNKSKLEVMGKGNIILKFGESTQIVSEVFFILELCNNLLSIGPLQDRGITIVIKHEVCKLYHPSRGCIR
ncbi:hypothetical protein KIW84_058291 [Lathyrus oleraceus]|uniref:Retrovirus-related Pol polyprotein from transposon TNT 1-94-like beta-barrel domain-containing protein n=2 Tax=Pisum sativum TaxID=3888 RepID=A0A9D4X6X1_PEA|nr:hypothetical protein KIW84_058291 [Pisum sativum]